MMTIALGLTRWWVSLYTAGLASEACDERRAEIESDLYEHGALNGGNGVGQQTTALEVLGRLLLGVPADLAWRVDRWRSAASEQRRIGRSRTMLERLSGRWLTALALLLAGFFIIPSFLVLLGNGSGFSTAGRLFFALVGISAGVAMLAGLLVGNRSPWLGAGLVAAGAIVMAMLWFWLFFILVPAALIVVTLSVVRARRETASRRPPQSHGSPAPS